jgi:hypothetical protein
MAMAIAALALLTPAAADAKKPKKPPKATFLVGAAKVSADPTEKICLGGYGDCGGEDGGRTMTHVKDPLFARSIAFADAKNGSFILAHTTNIGLFASYKTIAGVGLYHARQAIAARTGVPADHIVIQSDHSHAGPDTIGIWGGVPTSYLEQLQKATVDAAVQAWESRRPADVFVGTAEGHGITSSYASAPNLETDDEFRLLWAEDRETGERIATFANYSPHATVLGSGNKGASGDWPEWAALIAEARFGGTGLGSVGTLGREDFGAEDDGAKGEAEARARLERMVTDATAAASQVPAKLGVAARTVFIREPIMQPILFANLAPEGAAETATQGALGYDISIDRDVAPPWLTAATLGTYAGAARIGDVFLGSSPGEPFPEVQQYLRDEGGVTGARAHFHLGAANDFLGYMLRPVDHYPQVFTEGAMFLGGCPEEAIYEGFGLDYDGACPDHWTLMVSPTIGTHVACTIQAAAVGLGFGAAREDEACAELTATDAAGAPAEKAGSAKKRRRRS